MQRERVKKNYERRFRQTPSHDSYKLNKKMIFCILIFLFILIIKFLPITSVSSTINSIAKTNTDYALMFHEIKEVIIKHTVGDKVFHLPLTGEMMSQFGERVDPISFETTNHTGVDINATENTPVLAALDGEVIRVEENEYYGKFIMIQHKNNLQTLYGHLNYFNKAIGEQVKTGDEIALSGNTGRSTGPHLHFEIRLNNIPVDPMGYIVK